MALKQVFQLLINPKKLKIGNLKRCNYDIDSYLMLKKDHIVGKRIINRDLDQNMIMTIENKV